MDEQSACIPEAIDPNAFNPDCKLPYGLTTGHVQKAMEEFIDFLGFINAQLHKKGIPRLETFLMPANFSSMVGEFMHIGIERHCPTLVKNRYHNGHPDLIPPDKYRDNAVQHCTEGIEIKASRYEKGWQGHNAEECWLMVFVFKANRVTDREKNIEPMPFRFLGVFGAQLYKHDWQFSGRSATSRRTITAAVKKSGSERMIANWIYSRRIGPTTG